MKNAIIVIILALLTLSCEKIVDINYKNNEPKLIIEGNITNQSGPYFVKITKSISLNDTGSYPTVNNAEVSIADNTGFSEILTPQGTGLYKTDQLIGVEGRTYILTVKLDGQIYSAQSTMPPRVIFDSIKIEKVTMGGDTEYNLIPVFLDPSEEVNNYRFVLSVNKILVKQHLVLNDEIKNGLENTLKLEVDDEDLKLKPKDLITIEMQCIDKSVSIYYTTLALMANSGPGGGTTPNNPPNNISNGALGLFSAYTTEKRSTVIPK